VNIPAGETFIRRGDEPDAFYIVLRGRVSISLSIAGTDYTKRLRAYGPGTIVGEMGFFSQEVRSADIRTDVDSVLSRMTQAKLERLESEEPVLAGQICRLVIRTLSSRLRTANEEISHLL
jgi:SulP family sulfate permease